MPMSALSIAARTASVEDQIKKRIAVLERQWDSVLAAKMALYQEREDLQTSIQKQLQTLTSTEKRRHDLKLQLASMIQRDDEAIESAINENAGFFFEKETLANTFLEVKKLKGDEKAKTASMLEKEMELHRIELEKDALKLALEEAAASSEKSAAEKKTETSESSSEQSTDSLLRKIQSLEFRLKDQEKTLAQSRSIQRDRDIEVQRTKSLLKESDEKVQRLITLVDSKDEEIARLRASLKENGDDKSGRSSSVDLYRGTPPVELINRRMTRDESSEARSSVKSVIDDIKNDETYSLSPKELKAVLGDSALFHPLFKK
ncbi:hypothetical protein HDU97_000482 [Phlyctochytrium planicorne]|nr:hypothetical protein HDU97_000482 [Phlyctochytrium planicorne]